MQLDNNYHINNYIAFQARRNFKENTPPENSSSKKEFYRHLSKNVSYALRHKPKECGLSVDNKGYVSIEGLLQYLNNNGQWKGVTRENLVEMLDNIDKERFEIKDDKIRAYYGHSFKDRIIKLPTLPPEILYHGTSHEASEKILQEGLLPQARQYVHLSSDVPTALNVGSRKDENPVLLKINASCANQEGHKFYEGNKTVWLADKIPPKYIELIKK